MARILTPDQRLRVFISSTMAELAAERAAVRDAVSALHLTPVLFELGARPHPPAALYRAYLEQCHVFVGIYAESYGWVGPGMEISGVEDELRLAGDRPRLLYVREPAPGREPGLEALLEGVRVDYYGTLSPLQNVSNVTVADPRLIVVKPWEKAMIPLIEKAINAAGLGVNAMSDAELVRVPIPPLTEERRKELSRHVHKLAEEGRNTVRTIRREANDRLKKLLKDSKISEDDERKGLDEVQKITDQHIKLIDEAQKKKDADLLGH